MSAWEQTEWKKEFDRLEPVSLMTKKRRLRWFGCVDGKELMILTGSSVAWHWKLQKLYEDSRRRPDGIVSWMTLKIYQSIFVYIIEYCWVNNACTHALWMQTPVLFFCRQTRTTMTTKAMTSRLTSIIVTYANTVPFSGNFGSTTMITITYVYKQYRIT